MYGVIPGYYLVSNYTAFETFITHSHGISLITEISAIFRSSCMIYLHISFAFFFCLLFYSKFGDIFDEDFFIYALSKNVNVVKELPKDILERYNYNISSIVNLRLKAWSSPAYYLQKVLPQLLRLGYAIP